jgi:hypothetical protein
MTKAVAVAALLMLLGIFGCKRESGIVHADSEQIDASNGYQPRQAAAPDSPEAIRQRAKNDRTTTGQLLKVDVANNTFTLLTDKGIEQTFKLDNMTLLNGTSTAGNKAKVAANTNRIKELTGREGDVIMVEWEDPAGPKLATSVVLK